MSFLSWLSKYQYSNSYRGDFARFALNEQHFPKHIVYGSTLEHYIMKSNSEHKEFFTYVAKYLWEDYTRNNQMYLAGEGQ
ncbi:MAG: hypothetical protein KBT36_13290 [Kurthia sp.]|nr:hypothetical protein [Candidatus Kurthia equi]